MKFEAKTEGVRIIAAPRFLPEDSEPEEGRFAFAYTIRIENQGQDAVQLLSRRWSITDARGVTQEVQGPGVVGVQPVIPPAAAFEYTSGAVLGAASGVMVGAYAMVEPGSGRTFEAAVPAFVLEAPDARKGLAN